MFINKLYIANILILTSLAIVLAVLGYKVDTSYESVYCITVCILSIIPIGWSITLFRNEPNTELTVMGILSILAIEGLSISLLIINNTIFDAVYAIAITYILWLTTFLVSVIFNMLYDQRKSISDRDIYNCL